MSSSSRSRAMPVTRFDRLCVLELTKYSGRSTSSWAASRACTGAHQRRVIRAYPIWVPPSIRTRSDRRRPPIPPRPRRQAPLADLPQLRPERLTPRVAQPQPVVDRAAERRRALLGVGLAVGAVGRAGGADALVDLVPLDLEGDERRHEVVDVRRAREQDGERVAAAVVPAAPARGRLDRLPVLERPDAEAAEQLGVLAHRDPPRAHDAGRQAADRVEERAEVELVAVGERVQAGPGRAVRRLEHPQACLAARAQQRRGRPLVELDGVVDAVAGRGRAGTVDLETRDRHTWRPTLLARVGLA